MLPSTTLAPVVNIDVYSHCIKVTGSQTSQVRMHLVEYCRHQGETGLRRVGVGRYEQFIERVYAAYTRNRDEFRFHRNQLNEVVQFLRSRGIAESTININYVPETQYVKNEIRFTDPRSPRDEQIPMIAYLKEPCPEGYAPSKVITLQTGKGKGFISISALCHYSRRTVIIIRPGFIPKWIEELLEMTDMTMDDIMVVRGPEKGDRMGSVADLIAGRGVVPKTGGDMMRALLDLGKSGELKAKVIIISNVLFADYVESYMDQTAEGASYSVPPGEFYQTLGIGLRLIDEVHMDFHRNYRFEMYTHVPLTISLSATLDADKPFLNRRYDLMWPGAVRPPEVEYDAFIDVQSILYTINQPHLIRCKGFANSYSHTAFEKSILKNRRMLDNYKDMIAGVLDEVFVCDMQKGQSAIVFFATVDMCVKMRDHLRAVYPELHIEKFTAGDSYEECFLKPDVIISTVGKAGTAVDRPNLRENIMTNALNSKQANIQVLGRTRKLKDFPDVRPRFHFLSAREIPKHIEYAKAKEIKLRGKVHQFTTVNSFYRI